MRNWLHTLLLRRGKQPSKRKPEIQEKLDAFQGELGVQFKSLDLLEQALTHRSYLGSNGGDPNKSNERMEFLGDAVLELVVIEYLYAAYPDDREGALTKKKGLLVSRKVLANSAEWMKLGNYILLSDAEREAGGSARSSILADTLEAVIGAIYLDQGLESARKFVTRRLLDFAESIIVDLARANFKSQLQEYVQARFKTHPRYRVVTEVGPDHRKLFTVEVSVRGTLLGRGQGYNKKEAQQAAARNATVRLDSEGGNLENLPPKSPTADARTNSGQASSVTAAPPAPPRDVTAPSTSLGEADSLDAERTPSDPGGEPTAVSSGPASGVSTDGSEGRDPRAGG